MVRARDSISATVVRERSPERGARQLEQEHNPGEGGAQQLRPAAKQCAGATGPLQEGLQEEVSSLPDLPDAIEELGNLDTVSRFVLGEYSLSKLPVMCSGPSGHHQS